MEEQRHAQDANGARVDQVLAQVEAWCARPEAGAGWEGPVLVSARRTRVVDTLTALAMYDRLRQRDAPSFLLESLQGGEQWGRYSVVGVGAAVELVGDAEGVEVRVDGQAPWRVSPGEGEDVSGVVERVLDALHTEAPSEGRFGGGAVGYMGYEMARVFEPSLGAVQDTTRPLLRWVVPRLLVRFDQLQQRVGLIAFVDARGACAPGLETAERRARVAAALSQAEAGLDDLEARLSAPNNEGLASPVPVEALLSSRSGPLRALPEGATTSLGREAFIDRVERCKAYIRSGDIIQAVLSQRVTLPLEATVAADGDPLALYRRLRLINPSPYLFLLDLGDEQLIGASPEVLVRKEGDAIEVRPIAGTRRRGATRAEDAALAEDLLADPKERAEHIMLLDLGRNDVGRVSAIGSVTIPEQMVIERYSHVLHLVSHVCGRLRPELTWRDALASTFPAGTLSGAPKVRAMQIIDELEPVQRGVYGGAIGYIGFDGDMDLCIAIRTLYVRDGHVHAQAGAGIVADSNPDSEWQETLNKAAAALGALLR